MLRAAGGDPVTYHGLHAATAQPDHEPVDWSPSSPRAARVRIREHTCVCKRVVYELCTAGGLWFVRRLSDGPPVSVVESGWETARAVQALWSRILLGQAR